MYEARVGRGQENIRRPRREMNETRKGVRNGRRKQSHGVYEAQGVRRRKAEKTSLKDV